METALNGHLAGCGEQNKARDRWEQDRREWERNSDANMSAVCREVRSIQRQSAHSKGFRAAIMAVGIVLGSVASAVVSVLFQKFLGG